MSDWGARTYSEIARNFATYFEGFEGEYRSPGEGVGTYDLAVVDLWRKAMAAKTVNPNEIRELLALLEPENRTFGLHGGTVWEEVTLVIRKWAREQGVAKC